MKLIEGYAVSLLCTYFDSLSNIFCQLDIFQ